MPYPFLPLFLEVLLKALPLPKTPAPVLKHMVTAPVRQWWPMDYERKIYFTYSPFTGLIFFCCVSLNF